MKLNKYYKVAILMIATLVLNYISYILVVLVIAFLTAVGLLYEFDQDVKNLKNK